MLILLPPSEGKTRPTSGTSLDLAAMSFPALDRTRRRVLNALVRTCRGDHATAMAALGLGPTQSAEIAHNARLRTAPTGPAIEVYTGVLYEALDAATVTAAARRRLNASVAITSALFGLVHPRDPIPAYRLSGDTQLPGIGALNGVWRPAIESVLADAHGPILDLRSGVYVSLGPIPADAAQRAVSARVLLERNARRSVVSHHNKATKGRMVRALVEQGTLPTSVTGVVQALADLGFGVELHEPARADQPARMDVIVRDI